MAATVPEGSLESMALTPFLVARSQILTAVHLFFDDRDPVSVQALARNARELLEGLCRLRGIAPMTELLVRDHVMLFTSSCFSICPIKVPRLTALSPVSVK